MIILRPISLSLRCLLMREIRRPRIGPKNAPHSNATTSHTVQKKCYFVIMKGDVDQERAPIAIMHSHNSDPPDAINLSPPSFSIHHQQTITHSRLSPRPSGPTPSIPPLLHHHPPPPSQRPQNVVLAARAQDVPLPLHALLPPLRKRQIPARPLDRPLLSSRPHDNPRGR